MSGFEIFGIIYAVSQLVLMGLAVVVAFINP